MHPNYKLGPGLNADIALLQLSSPAKLNDRVVKACMPSQGVYPKAGTNCYIAGNNALVSLLYSVVVAKFKIFWVDLLSGFRLGKT